MILSFYIRKLLQERCGHELRLSSDCDFLAHDIESKTGEHVGVNTVKRLLGFIADERHPRASTLDIVARYLGYESWGVLAMLDDKSNSSFTPTDGELRSADLQKGAKVEIAYLPDRRVLMEHRGEGCFVVLSSVNSKLAVGDELMIQHFVKGYPLLVTDVIRGGRSMGSFTAGKTNGLTEIHGDFGI